MSTRRADFRAGLLAILDAFKADWNAAHPGSAKQIRQTHKTRPATFDPSLLYVGPITEPTVLLEMGNRLVRADMRATLVIVEGIYDNTQAADLLDEKGDALLTFLVTEHARVSGSTLLEPTGGPEDVDLTIPKDGGGVLAYPAAIIPVRLNSLD